MVEVNMSYQILTECKHGSTQAPSVVHFLTDFSPNLNASAAVSLFYCISLWRWRRFNRDFVLCWFFWSVRMPNSAEFGSSQARSIQSEISKSNSEFWKPSAIQSGRSIVTANQEHLLASLLFGPVSSAIEHFLFERWLLRPASSFLDCKLYHHY